MKLALKLAAAVILAMCLVRGIAAYLRVQREIDLFQHDMARDLEGMGLDLAAAVVTVWQLGGPDAARTFIEQVNATKGHVTIQWVAAPFPSSDVGPPGLGTDGVVHEEPDERRFALPVNVNGTLVGRLELSESRADERHYIRATIRRTLVITTAMIAASGLAAMLVGLVMVGLPVRQLVGQARRVAGGDFSGRLHLRQRDELATLAGEMNLMCDQLADAQRRLAEETSARLATLEQLRHADRLGTIGQLASGIAHELGTPLNVIMARAKMIYSGEAEDEDVRHCARVVAEQAERMTRIIRQMLDFARRRTPMKALTDVGEVTRRSISMLEPSARRRGVTLRYRQDEQPLSVLADAEHLGQVLTNLLLNGIQAMQQGGDLEVKVGVDRPSGPGDRDGTRCVRIDVADQGCGIAPEDLKRVFEPFYTTKGAEGGTGLGLSIAEEIVREHGGWLEIRSELGRGTCFSVFVPEESGVCAAAS